MTVDNVADFYDVLSQIRHRPGMWVPDRSLRTIESMAFSYSLALRVHNVSEWPRF